MIYKIATFKVKPESLDACLAVIKTFVAAIKANESGVLTYESFQYPDQVSFMHLMCFQDESAEKAHQHAEHTKMFVSVLYPNCAIQPKFETLQNIQ